MVEMARTRKPMTRQDRGKTHLCMDPLDTHPIFSLPRTATGPLNDARNWLELSTSTLPNFTHVSPTDDEPAPSGRRQVMVLRDSDLIVAAGKELRITHLGDTKISQSTQKQYKVPNICVFQGLGY